MRRRFDHRTANESGVALLSALFAVALLTVIVIEMTDATMVHTTLNRNAGNAIAAQLLARSAAIAGEALVSDDNANPQNVTCPQNLWALPLFGIPAGAGVVGLQITDEGGKLDLNSLRDQHDQSYRTAIESLFTALDLDPTLVGRVAAWVAKPDDAAMATGGASDYCALAMPCAPRQLPLNSIEELLLIRGFDEQVLARLRPFVTAAPPSDGRTTRPVNLLTAKPEVLSALGCEGSSAPPACPMSFGGEEGEKNKDWQTELGEWKTKNCSAAKLLATTSNLFSIYASGTVGDVTQSLRTVVRRKGKNVDRLWWQERPVSEVLPVEVH